MAGKRICSSGKSSMSEQTASADGGFDGFPGVNVLHAPAAELPRSPTEGSRVEAACWANCRADFAFDGALVDLLAPGTGPGEWEAFWTALLAGPFGLQAFREGEPVPRPESAAWFFAEGEAAPVMVSVLAGPITANCHFFGGDLKLDIDPREVGSEAAFESVLAVMRLVAAAVRKPVFAGAEGGRPEYAFIRVSPDGRAVFLKAGSVRHGEPDASADGGGYGS